MPGSKLNGKAIRYAVVGLGHIAQEAVLPAFAHANRNSKLTALVSSDPLKLRELGSKYGVNQLFTYDQYEDCLKSGQVDAVYIALPNHLHREFAVRAAQAGVHILCEKPMALSEADCLAMIEAAANHDVRLMVAYRLHLEQANLKAVEIVGSGQLGEPRIFTSSFTMQAKEGGIRLQEETGGGPLYDIGIYCINAARYLFQNEPYEVFAACAQGTDPRFQEVDEMTSAILRFPNDRVASFTCSFGAADTSSYRVIGTKGDLRVEPAYEYQGKLTHFLTIDGKTKRKAFSARDQFAPELIYFSQCVMDGVDPEPSGQEGLADVRIIEALFRSARDRRSCLVEPVQILQRPNIDQEIRRPPVKRPHLVHVENPIC
jgi:predicted dehydrogenase